MKKSAFSLIELSVVIVIIGILVAGVTQASRLVSAMRLNAARAKTLSSPVASIKGLVLWLETTSEKSFPSYENLEDDLSINSSTYYWADINPQSSIKSNAAAATGPDYKVNCINGLPCLNFDGSSEFLDISQNNGIVSEMSVFMVLNSAGSGARYLLGYKGATSSTSNYFIIYLTSSNTMTYGTYPGSLAPGVILANSSSYIWDMVDSGSSLTISTSRTNNTISRTTLANAMGAKNLNGLTIGSSYNGTTRANYYSGNIGEIIVFERALKTEERNSIEEYLSKKWNIRI